MLPGAARAVKWSTDNEKRRAGSFRTPPEFRGNLRFGRSRYVARQAPKINPPRRVWTNYCAPQLSAAIWHQGVNPLVMFLYGTIAQPITRPAAEIPIAGWEVELAHPPPAGNVLHHRRTSTPPANTPEAERRILQTDRHVDALTRLARFRRRLRTGPPASILRVA